jgi:hypothetical protein
MPYAAKVIQRELDNEQEVEHARKGRWKEIDVNGVLAQDVLRIVLSTGQASSGKVSRDVTRDKRAARSYLKALKNAGLVRLKKIKGSLVAFPPKPKES